MPTTCGPCRFGLYHLLQKLLLRRAGLSHRVRIWSPEEGAYFEGLGQGFGALTLTGILAKDLLTRACDDVRPVETVPGAAREIEARFSAELIPLLEREATRVLSAARALWEVTSGRLFGCADLLRRAATELAAVKGTGEVPTVLVVGEIYVRCEPFANDFVVERLERCGLRVRVAPPSEWLEYVSDLGVENGNARLSDRLSNRLEHRIFDRSYAIMAAPLGWPARSTVRQMLRAAAPYLRSDLHGEAVLTLGGALHEWRVGHIDGAVSVGPLECMPNKIAEAQLFHVGEREGLPSLTLSLNGDGLDPDSLDHFVYEVKTRFEERRRGEGGAQPPQAPT
jgi:predicted nucleotide-binding protein (sugar kinase/HSP70/actin superfamily)